MPKIIRDMEEFVAVQILEHGIPPGQAVSNGAGEFPEHDPLEMCFCLTAVAVGSLEIGGERFRAVSDHCFSAAALLAADIYANSLGGNTCRTLRQIRETWGDDDPFFAKNDEVP